MPSLVRKKCITFLTKSSLKIEVSLLKDALYKKRVVVVASAKTCQIFLRLSLKNNCYGSTIYSSLMQTLQIDRSFW